MAKITDIKKSIAGIMSDILSESAHPKSFFQVSDDLLNHFLDEMKRYSEMHGVELIINDPAFAEKFKDFIHESSEAGYISFSEIDRGPLARPGASAKIVRSDEGDVVNFPKSKRYEDWRERVCDDFEKWSGGWNPNTDSVSEEDVDDYVEHAMPSDLGVSDEEVRSYLLNPSKVSESSSKKLRDYVSESFWATTTDYTSNSSVNGEDFVSFAGVPLVKHDSERPWHSGIDEIKKIDHAIAENSGKVTPGVLRIARSVLDTEGHGAKKLVTWLKWVMDNNKTIKKLDGGDYLSY